MAIGQVKGIMTLAFNGQREAAPLKHLNLPDDLFDHEDQEQAAIDAGECSDTLGIWRGPPKAL